MKQFTRRIWFAAVLMACGWIGTAWVRAGYQCEIKPLTQKLDTLPLKLEGYQGTDTPIDPEIQKVLNSDSSINRVYRRVDGTSMTIHISSFVASEEIAQVVPHDPHVCYTSAGWRIIEERQMEIETAIGKLPYRILQLEKNGIQSELAFWYQMGNSNFSSFAEGKRVHREFWGKKEWPATIKFMIQVEAPDVEASKPLIEPIVSYLYHWAANL